MLDCSLKLYGQLLAGTYRKFILNQMQYKFAVNYGTLSTSDPLTDWSVCRSDSMSETAETVVAGISESGAPAQQQGILNGLYSSLITVSHVVKLIHII